MKLKKILALALVLMFVLSLAACGGAAGGDSGGDAGAKTFAIITKSAGNPYNEREASGFEEAIKAAGHTAIVKHPTEITAEAQITLVNELIAQEVDGIAIAGNDLDALETVLKEAMGAGIACICLDSKVNAASRQTFVNQAGVTQVAQSLMDAVLDLTGGSGQWAILSATSTATNQNAWIEAMNQIATGADYSGLELVETAYGDDMYQKSVDETLALINNYPDLKVICAPTTVGIAAASKVVKDEGLTGKVIVTGLGLPSEMAEYIGTGDGFPCPYMYLWNPIEVGACAAYTLMAIDGGEVTGAEGDSFTAANGTTYTVVAADDGGTEVIVGPPFGFTPENIADWKDVY
jgi:rhamnose transport system substrate-binding protein